MAVGYGSDLARCDPQWFTQCGATTKQFQTLYHIMAAGAVITLVPIIVVFIFLQRYFVRGLTEGATKG